MAHAEIREYMDEHLKKGTIPDHQVGLRLLSEIAAQLADIREILIATAPGNR